MRITFHIGKYTVTIMISETHRLKISERRNRYAGRRAPNGSTATISPKEQPPLCQVTADFAVLNCNL